jgi:acetyl-CoA acyltransferase 1
MQVSDGAAVTLLMTRREALARGLPVMAVFRSFAAVGVDPAIMGVGPAVAIPKAVKMAGLTIDDIDVYEINEAFASQAMYCVNELGIPSEKVRTSCMDTCAAMQRIKLARAQRVSDERCLACTSDHC